MSWVVDLVISVAMAADSCATAGTCGLDGEFEPYWTGSSFHAVGAAFQTVGLYLQADILDAFMNSDFGALAPLIYVIAAAAGMVQMVLGSPPRNYLWFFLGPPIFLWLTTTLEPKHGTPWMAGRAEYVEEDQRRQSEEHFNSNQEVMWQMAEAGLANLAIVGNHKIIVRGTKGPSRAAMIATPFAWWNELTTSVTDRLVAMFAPGHAWITGENDSNLGTICEDNSNPRAVCGGGDDGIRQYEEKWQLLGPTKWEMIANLTETRFQNADSRDALAYFLSSECGEALSRSINKEAMTQAATSRGTGLPLSVFNYVEYSGNYNDAWGKLNNAWVPMPRALSSLLARPSGGAVDRASFYKWWNTYIGAPLEGSADDDPVPDSAEDIIGREAGGNTTVNCRIYFELIVSLFRWEAANAYSQLIRTGYRKSEKTNAPDAKYTEKEVLYALYYGWGVRSGDPKSTTENRHELPVLDLKKLKQFTISMQTMYAIKNELKIAPQFTDVRYSTSQQTVRYVEAQQSSTGSVSKFGELWVWAMMVPYFQGLLFYFLSAMYPFACLVTIFPGMHKAVFTWMSFWLWAKLWDVGFAVCVSLERAIWAILGNNSNTEEAFDWILTLTSAGTHPLAGNIGEDVKVGCADVDGTDFGTRDTELATCRSGLVVVEPLKNGMSPDGPGHSERFGALTYIFDTGMMTGGNLSFDTNNAYYVYIISALYFAVPTVTGQLVLLGKQGMSGLVTSGLERQAQQGGSGAQGGYTADVGAKLNQASAMAGQATYEKGLRSGGLAGMAIASGNQAWQQGIDQSVNGAEASAIGSRQSARGMLAQRQETALGFAKAGTDAIYGQAEAALSSRGGGGGANPQGPGAEAEDRARRGRRGLAAFRSAIDIGYAGGRHAITSQSTADQTGMEAQKADRNLAGARAGAGQQTSNLAQGRLQEAANYDGQNRQADQMRNTQLANAGILGASGQSPSYNYQRPTGMMNGAAMMGMLDTYSSGPGGAPRRENNLQGAMWMPVNPALMNTPAGRRDMMQDADGNWVSNPSGGGNTPLTPGGINSRIEAASTHFAGPEGGRIGGSTYSDIVGTGTGNRFTEATRLAGTVREAGGEGSFMGLAGDPLEAYNTRVTGAEAAARLLGIPDFGPPGADPSPDE